MVMPNLDCLAWRRGVIAQRDALADEGGIDFLDGAIETDRAIGVHFTYGFKQEHIVQVGGRVEEGDLLGAGRPAIQWCLAAEAVVRGVMVLAFDPGVASLSKLKITGRFLMK